MRRYAYAKLAKYAVYSLDCCGRSLNSNINNKATNMPLLWLALLSYIDKYCSGLKTH